MRFLNCKYSVLIKCIDSSISVSAIDKQKNDIAIIYVMLAWRPSFARSFSSKGQPFNLVLPSSPIKICSKSVSWFMSYDRPYIKTEITSLCIYTCNGLRNRWNWGFFIRRVKMIAIKGFKKYWNHLETDSLLNINKKVYKKCNYRHFKAVNLTKLLNKKTTLQQVYLMML